MDELELELFGSASTLQHSTAYSFKVRGCGCVRGCVHGWVGGYNCRFHHYPALPCPLSVQVCDSVLNTGPITSITMGEPAGSTEVRRVPPPRTLVNQ